MFAHKDLQEAYEQVNVSTIVGRFDIDVKQSSNEQYLSQRLKHFLLNVEVLDNGCWDWQGNTRPNGYSRMWFSGDSIIGHKFAYLVWNGEIPQGLQIDHTCHRSSICDGGYDCPHRRCVNPKHLEVITQQENLLRSENNIVTQNSNKTHCKRGHAFTDENTRISKDGKRHCRACARLHARKSYRRNTDREVQEYKPRHAAREYDAPETPEE